MSQLPKLPFGILLCHHPDDERELDAYIKETFRSLMADVSKPALRCPGITVHHWSALGHEPSAWQQALPQTSSGLIILLLGPSLLIDKNWEDISGQLLKVQQQHPGWACIPVGLHEGALDYGPIRAGSYHVERIMREKPKHQLGAYRFMLAFEAAKKLYPAPSGRELKPLQLFLSFSHHDGQGASLAKGITATLSQTAELATFFDVADTIPGVSFEDRIFDAMQESLVLVIRSDSYGDRGFCRREVLTAKKQSRPVVVLNAFDEGEGRAFPYMGNVLQLHYHPQQKLKKKAVLKIVTRVLLEACRHRYQEAYVQEYCQHFGYDPEEYISLPAAPELLGKAQQSYGQDHQFLCYPDPPLGFEEEELIRQTLSPQWVCTPATLSIKDFSPTFLQGKKVALSVSEPDKLAQNGSHWLHIYMALTELSRYLLRAGATLVYGGHLGYRRDVNVLEVLLQQADNHRPTHEAAKAIINILAVPFHASKDMMARYLRQIQFINCPLPNWAESLEDGPMKNAAGLVSMREQLAERADLLIVLGGKTEGYSGIYPGLLHEVWQFAKAGKSVFVLGGFGGIAHEMLEAFAERPNHLNYNKELLDAMNQHAPYLPLLDDMLASICTSGRINPGMEESEQQVMQESTHLPLLISTVLKSIDKV